MKKIYIYDTTLRDGAQTQEISFSVEDKLRIAQKLAEFGVDYVEGGWPGSNPRDVEFFKKARKIAWNKTELTAFGSTRRKGVQPQADPNLCALIDAGTPGVTLFGKSWDFHVVHLLKASLDENLDMIRESVEYLKKQVGKVFYDAEHFFDGYKENWEYALKTLQAAVEGGADQLVLCDTNGGSLPHEVAEIVKRVFAQFKIPLGIHCHNDGDVAVANSLVAVREGVTSVQGTFNGYGERCGNANLTSVIPDLQLKMGYFCVPSENLSQLREVSRFIEELANLPPRIHRPYVGDAAFAHKGGVHVSAVRKNPKAYEHIAPEVVGNKRNILVSDLSGTANVLEKAERFGVQLEKRDSRVKKILEELKKLEHQGYQFEGAEASFELLMKKALGRYKKLFRLIDFRVIDEKRKEGEAPHSKATITIEVDGQKEHTTAEGNGPVNALDNALRKALEKFFPALKKVELLDYKVRVLSGHQGTGSTVRVLIESGDRHDRWGTVGVSENIIEASWQALMDSVEYKLLKDTSKGKK